MNNSATDVIEDRTDVKRALVAHNLSGELFIVEYCSLWHDQECVGTRIIEASDAIVRRDLLTDDEQLEPSPALFDRISNWEGLISENAEWLQAEEDAGRLAYPIGVA
jgi:hypothetical protein